MIKSKFNDTAIPAFWITLSVIILLLVGEIYFLYYHFVSIHRSEISVDVIISQLIIFGFLLFASVWLKTVASTITINTEQNTITFTNYFNKHSETYSLNVFDGYIQTIGFSKNNARQFKVLCLLKDKIIIRKISGAFYTNIDELQEALNSLNNLGFEKFGIIKELKIFFKQPVLD
ncbi:MAG TPA: hypothetical protein VFT78_09700 [Hanamia sp.]|nr:hypothetical protein [Hanamia sp.]